MSALNPNRCGPNRSAGPYYEKTIDDLAADLLPSKSSLYKLAQCGKVSGQKVGKYWRFIKSVIDDWLREQEGVSS